MARQRTGDSPMAHYEAALQGDTEAFWKLVLPHERIIFAAALGVLRTGERAEDVLHDVYVRAFTTLGSLRSPEKLSWWLYSMARNVAHEHLRKQGRQERLRTDSRALPRVISVPDLMIKEEELRMLSTAMQHLPEAHRTVLAMKYMNHFSCNQIAEVLGIGVEAAKSRLFEARKLLRKKMTAMEKKQAAPVDILRGVQNGGDHV